LHFGVVPGGTGQTQAEKQAEPGGVLDPQPAQPSSSAAAHAVILASRTVFGLSKPTL
jgi:hypothetical protein